jgi:hypothetical protein
VLSAVRGRPERTFTLTEYQKSVHIAARLLARYGPKADVRLYLRWLKAWRSEGMKYIWASDRHDELYDLDADPTEQRNRIGEMPEVADRMRIEMEDFLASLPMADYGDRVPVDRIEGTDPIARLRGLEFYREVDHGEEDVLGQR